MLTAGFEDFLNKAETYLIFALFTTGNPTFTHIYQRDKVV